MPTASTLAIGQGCIFCNIKLSPVWQITPTLSLPTHRFDRDVCDDRYWFLLRPFDSHFYAHRGSSAHSRGRTGGRADSLTPQAARPETSLSHVALPAPQSYRAHWLGLCVL